MQTPYSAARLLAAMSAAGVLVLAGCGGGSSGNASPEAAQAADTPSNTATTTSAESDGPPALITQEIRNVTAPDVTTATSDSGTTASATTDAASADLAVTAAPATALGGQSEALATSVDATAAATGVTSLDIFVATDGNDAWSGLLSTANASRSDGPVRTIAAAQAVARRKLAAMAAGTITRVPVNVRIAAGEYTLAAPLNFDSSDSGVPGSPVVYRAESAGTVTLSGALRVGTATGGVSGSTVTLPAPSIDASNMRGATQLYVNGRRATLARTPNVGNYWFVTKVVPLASEPTEKVGYEAFETSATALAAINALSTADRSRAVVNVMQAWSAGAHRISSLATPSGSVRVTPRTLWPFLNFGTDQRVYIENVASALDAPGEWLWDANGVRYIATSLDAGQSLKFEMPLLDRLLVVKGNASTGAWVQDLEFRGLNFAYTRQLVPDAGFVDGQAGSNIGAAIEVDGARRLILDSCTIAHTGNYGVWLRNNVRQSQVTNCQMSDLGGGGVKVGLTAQATTDANPTGANAVRGNSIAYTGKVIPGAAGIWVGQSSDNTVANNLVANTTHSGISVGWNWNYGSANAYRNSITGNLLINIGLGQMSDMGAIYTLGESTGTVITGNVIHEVRPYPGYGAGAWGLYNDGASTGILWEKNIVVGTNDGGYLLHYGRNNTVRNNLLAFGDRGEVRVTKTDPTATKLAFDSNILIPKNTAPLVAYASSPDVIYTGNQVSGRVLTTPPDITKCGTGCARGTAMVAVGSDPRVITASGVDSSTATWVSQTGLASGPAWLAASGIPAVNATLPAAVVAPPVGYVAEIAGTAIGAQPLNLRYRTGGSNANISVQAATGTPSGKALRFIDSASIVNRWEPYAWATLNHKTGSTTAEFSIMVDSAANFLYEWRDDANVYLTGPSLRVKASGIEVAGKIVAPTVVGQWMTLKVTAPLSTAASTWTLEVRYASGSVTTVTGLTNKNAAWQRLNWMGFVSDSATTSTTNIGYIKADNTAPN